MCSRQMNVNSNWFKWHYLATIEFCSDGHDFGRSILSGQNLCDPHSFDSRWVHFLLTLFDFHFSKHSIWNMNRIFVLKSTTINNRNNKTLHAPLGSANKGHIRLTQIVALNNSMPWTRFLSLFPIISRVIFGWIEKS